MSRTWNKLQTFYVSFLLFWAEFRYLGQLLTATDDDWPAVAGNIKKAQRSWGQLAWVLGREGADPKVSRTFYIAVTQQVLLFRAETWVLTKMWRRPWTPFRAG